MVPDREIATPSVLAGIGPAPRRTAMHTEVIDEMNIVRRDAATPRSRTSPPDVPGSVDCSLGREFPAGGSSR